MLGIRVTTIIALASLITCFPAYAFPPRSSHTLSFYHNAAPPNKPLKNLNSTALQSIFSTVTHTLVGEDQIAFLGFFPTFRVVDSPWPNAFARGSSEIVLTTALLDSVENERELAFVIAHELGHLRLGHTHANLGSSDSALVRSNLGKTYALREIDADCFAHNLLIESSVASSSDGAQLLRRIVDQRTALGSIGQEQFSTLSRRIEVLEHLEHSGMEECQK